MWDDEDVKWEQEFENKEEREEELARLKKIEDERIRESSLACDC